jgi:DNA-binding protein YbaB
VDERILDPDGAQERLAAWKGRIDKLAADTKSMSAQLQGLRIVAKDPAGMAEVTIDSTGSMTDLKLTERMTGARPETVAATIMATLADARKQLAERSKEIVADTMRGVGRPNHRSAVDGARESAGHPALEAVAVSRLDGVQDGELRRAQAVAADQLKLVRATARPSEAPVVGGTRRARDEPELRPDPRHGGVHDTLGGPAADGREAVARAG